MQEISETKKRKAKRQRRPRGQLHCTPDKASGIYYLRGTIRGQVVRESTGTADAAIADAIRVKRESELLNESVHGKKVTSTFGDCAEHYLRVNDGGSNRRWLPPLIAHFGDTLARDMDTTLVHAYVEKHKAHCTGVSKNNMVVNPIITVLRSAALAGLCDLPAIQRYEGESKTITGPGENWINDFLARCDRPKLKAYVMLLTTTGCRGIDGRRLRSEHVNYEAKTAYLPKTKNGDARTLELVEPLIELLKSFAHSPKGTVFGYSRTEVANREIEKCCKRIGMEFVSGHRLGRHAIAERLLDQGWTLKEVADAIGWKDIVTLHKRYGHLEKSKLASKLRDAASGVMRGSIRAVK